MIKKKRKKGNDSLMMHQRFKIHGLSLQEVKCIKIKNQIKKTKTEIIIRLIKHKIK